MLLQPSWEDDDRRDGRADTEDEAEGPVCGDGDTDKEEESWRCDRADGDGDDDARDGDGGGFDDSADLCNRRVPKGSDGQMLHDLCFHSCIDFRRRSLCCRGSSEMCFCGPFLLTSACSNSCLLAKTVSPSLITRFLKALYLCSDAPSRVMNADFVRGICFSPR